MARCPRLDYDSRTVFGNYDDAYICSVTGMRMNVNDPKLSSVCKCDYGEAYRNCPIYKKA